MMLYLTGSSISPIDSNWGNPQTNIEKSLGGFVSNSPVPNAALNKIFDSISSVTLRDKQFEIIGVGLVNRFEGKVATNIVVKIINSDNNLAKYEIAVNELTDKLLMEHIENRYQEPIQSTFFNSDFKRACVDIIINSLGAIGEIFTIEPFGVNCEILESSYDGIYSSVAKQFDGDEDYNVKRINDNTIRIERKDESTIEPFPCSYYSDGGISLSFLSYFMNPVDNSKELSDLRTNKGFGIWIKRIIDENSILSNNQIIENFLNGVSEETSEQVEIVFSYNLVEESNYEDNYSEEYS